MSYELVCFTNVERSDVVTFEKVGVSPFCSVKFGWKFGFLAGSKGTIGRSALFCEAGASQQPIKI